MILVIDNYDSFTYNLVQYLGELGAEIRVVRNDQISVHEAEDMNPDRVLISPGPCTPNEAGISVEVIRALGARRPLLGVCLGHQSIGAAFGAEVVRADRIMHGKTSAVFHDEKGVFRGLPNPFEATRYHSLIVKRDSLPDCLEVSAWTDRQEIMGLRHKSLPIHGVQFHPESVATENGHALIANFLDIAGVKRLQAA